MSEEIERITGGLLPSTTRNDGDHATPLVCLDSAVDSNTDNPYQAVLHSAQCPLVAAASGHHPCCSWSPGDTCEAS